MCKIIIFLCVLVVSISFGQENGFLSGMLIFIILISLKYIEFKLEEILRRVK